MMSDRKDGEPLLEELQSKQGDYELKLNLHHRRIVIHNRYEWLHIFNDGLQALEFLIGSILFYFASLENLALAFFVIGSAQMAIRPIIRISQKIHKHGIEVDLKTLDEQQNKF